MRRYSNSRYREIVGELVHSKRDREILIDRYVDGLTFEKLAEKHDISVRQAQNIIYKYDKLLLLL